MFLPAAQATEVGEPLQLYKLASTIFLGIGIAAVLQGRLVPRKPDYPISERARGSWATFDIVAAFAVLVFIGVGEATALRVVQSGKPTPGDETLTIALLAATTLYVVIATSVQRALSFVWTASSSDDEQPALNKRLCWTFVTALGGGIVLGTALVLAVIYRSALEGLVVPIAGVVGGLIAMVAIMKAVNEIHDESDVAIATQLPVSAAASLFSSMLLYPVTCTPDFSTAGELECQNLFGSTLGGLVGSVHSAGAIAIGVVVGAISYITVSLMRT